MKTRIISAAVAIVLLLAVILAGIVAPIVYGVAVAVLAVMAVFEALYITGIIKDPFILIVCLVYAVFAPFVYGGAVNFDPSLVNILFGALLLIVSLIRHKSIDATEPFYGFSLSMFITFAFSSVLMLIKAPAHYGLFYFFLICIFAWITDTGAYFTGVMVGRRKLCPSISPKKTVEGAVGGLVLCEIVTLVTAFIFNTVSEVNVSLLLIVLTTPIFSIAGMVGDLAASQLKRHCGIKDYGRIMPGHGGVLDRFDSVLFIAPLLYFLTRITEHI